VAKNTWYVVTKNGAHTILAEHGYFSGRIKVFVDGELVLKRFKQHSPWSLSSLHSFQIGGEEAAFYIVSPDMVRYKYDLFVGGRSITTDQPIPAELVQESRNHVPIWGWLFAPACILSYIAGYILVIWGLDAQPASYFIWHGLAIAALIFCLRILGNSGLAVRDRFIRALGVVGGVFIISAAAAGIVVLLNSAYWHTVTSASGAYSVVVPCEFTEETSGDPTLMLCHDANMEYAVWYEDLSSNLNGHTPDELVSAIMSDMTDPDTGQRIEIFGKKETIVNGHPGWEYTARHEGSMGVLRAYVIGHRLYQMSVTAKTKTYNSRRASHFLDSLQVSLPID